MALVWASLALAILLATIGAVVVFRSGLALWRDLNRGGNALANGLEELGERLERTSARLERLDQSTVRLDPSLARLQITVARLVVLRAAAQDVQDSVNRVVGFAPRS
jgi:hypothetical protein